MFFLLSANQRSRKNQKSPSTRLSSIDFPAKASPTILFPDSRTRQESTMEDTGITERFRQVLRPGVGDQHPKKSSTVTVHYSGWTTDGKLFDSSVVRGQPAKFPLSRVIPGWTEGVQLMVAGEKRRFWIPEDLAYKGASGAPQGMLVFDVELISIE